MKAINKVQSDQLSKLELGLYNQFVSKFHCSDQNEKCAFIAATLNADCADLRAIFRSWLKSFYSEPDAKKNYVFDHFYKKQSTLSECMQNIKKIDRNIFDINKVEEYFVELDLDTVLSYDDVNLDLKAKGVTAEDIRIAEQLSGVIAEFGTDLKRSAEYVQSSLFDNYNIDVVITDEVEAFTDSNRNYPY